LFPSARIRVCLSRQLTREACQFRSEGHPRVFPTAAVGMKHTTIHTERRYVYINTSSYAGLLTLTQACLADCDKGSGHSLGMMRTTCSQPYHVAFVSATARACMIPPHADCTHEDNTQTHHTHACGGTTPSRNSIIEFIPKLHGKIWFLGGNSERLLVFRGKGVGL
jgi:hypothetical protein